MTEEIEMATLTNGTQVPMVAVMSSRLVLESLFARKDAIAIYELLELCKDHNHRLFGSTEQVLIDAGVLPVEGGRGLSETMRQLILCSVAEKGLLSYTLIPCLKKDV